MFCLTDFEEKAKGILAKEVFEQYASGADQQQTLKDNRDAFSRYRFRPRVLRNVSKVNLQVQLQGEWVESPVGVAPTSLHKMAHEDGEIATAQACASTGTCMILSSWSTTSMEEVAAAAAMVQREGQSAGPRWYQLNIFCDRAMLARVVHRAEQAGYKALVMTVDIPVPGRKLANERNQFRLPAHIKLPNFDDRYNNGSEIYHGEKVIVDSSMNWDDLDWLCSQTHLPVILKGILTREDAREALRHRGVRGIVVSNHGARQLDGVPATIDALSEVVSEVRGRLEVYLDGGVRQGTDVLKALALGAKAVFVGRPVLWGLACGGRQGVEQVLGMLREELKLAMQLAGCSSAADVTQDLVVHEQYYKKFQANL